MAEDETQLLAKCLLELLDDRNGSPAVRALEITVLDERDRGRRRPLDVVAFADRQREARIAFSDTVWLLT